MSTRSKNLAYKASSELLSNCSTRDDIARNIFVGKYFIFRWSQFCGKNEGTLVLPPAEGPVEKIVATLMRPILNVDEGAEISIGICYYDLAVSSNPQGAGANIFSRIPTLPSVPALDEITKNFNSAPCKSTRAGYVDIGNDVFLSATISEMLKYCPDLPEATPDKLEILSITGPQGVQDPLSSGPEFDSDYLFSNNSFVMRPMRLCEAEAVKSILQDRYSSLAPYVEAIRQGKIDDELREVLERRSIVTAMRHIFYFLDCIPNTPLDRVYVPHKTLLDLCCSKVLASSHTCAPSHLLQQLINWWSGNFDPAQPSHRHYIAKFIKELGEKCYADYIVMMHQEMASRFGTLASILRMAYAVSKRDFAGATKILSRCGNPLYWRSWLLTFLEYASKPIGTVI
jgi:hypothetical protein